MSTHTPHTSRRWFGFRPRTLIALALVIALGAGALGADLALHGRVYELLWQTTGETEPLAQLLGFGQYLMRWTRAQPHTEPYADVPLANFNPFGVNTFLDQEVLPERREQQVRMIAEAGFGWIRQAFRWEDIEIHGKGDFTDRRNDLDGDGQITEADAVSAWAKYDHIVDLAEQYGLQILVRLSAPPRWSQPTGTTNPYTPPADVQDFVDFAVAVAQRYKGRLHYYQIWNEPNLYPEWGDQTVSAEGYTEMLCRTYRALKAVDPQIVVVTGAIGPTVDLSGRNAYDLLYVQRMYQAGAGDCFDVLSVQGYGLWSGPTDRRLRQVTVNFQRHLWLRDMMIANGDAHKPIWISEAGWNPVPDDPNIADLNRYGRVSEQQAAEWAPLAYARAIREWPWLGPTFWWYFKRADTSEQGQSWYYFRLLEPDFTPTPTWEALRAYITNGKPKTLGAGRHGVWRGTPQIGADGTLTLRVRGTGVGLCFAESGTARAQIDERAPQTFEVAAGTCVWLARDLRGGDHTVQVSGVSPESVLVLDWRRRRALLAGAVALALFVSVGAAIWRARRR